MTEGLGRMTAAEYLASPETNRRRELAWGVLREPAAPNWDHQMVVGRVYERLNAHVRRLELGRVGLSPLDVILDPIHSLVVQPDVFFIAAERTGIIRGRVWGAPDLVVEVLSSSSTHYDREEKRTWYAQYGVRELWLADPRTAAVGVVDLTNPAADIVMSAGPQIVRSRVLPRLRMKASNAFV